MHHQYIKWYLFCYNRKKNLRTNILCRPFFLVNDTFLFIPSTMPIKHSRNTYFSPCMRRHSSCLYYHYTLLSISCLKVVQNSLFEEQGCTAEHHLVNMCISELAVWLGIMVSYGAQLDNLTQCVEERDTERNHGTIAEALYHHLSRGGQNIPFPVNNLYVLTLAH